MGKIEKTFWWLCFILAIYTTIGFKVIPGVLKDQLIKNLDENLTLKSSIEKVEFNPYSLTARIYNYKLGLQNPTASFDKLTLDLGLLRSITDLHANVQEVKLEKLYLNVVENKDGTFNLTQLVKPSTTKQGPEKQESSSDIKFLVSKIFLENSKIDFTKLKNDKSYKITIHDLNYKLRDLGTFEDSLSSNDLELKINEFTKLSVEGAFRLVPFKMYGKTKLEDLRVKEVLDYDMSSFNFALNKEANVNIDLDFNIDTSKQIDIKLNSTNININNLKLSQDGTDIASLKKFDISKFDFDLVKQSIYLDTPTIDSLNLNLIQNKTGLNFANLVKSNTNETKEETTNTKPWIVKLNNTNLKNLNAKYSDTVNNMTVSTQNNNSKLASLDINGSNIDLKNFSLNAPSISFSDNKNALSVKTQNIDTKLSSLKIANSNIDLNQLSLNTPKVSFEDRKNSLSVITNKIGINLDKLNLVDNKTSINSIKLNTNALNFKDKSSIRVNTTSNAINANNINIDGSNISVNSLNTTLSNINFDEIQSKLNIKVNQSKINASNLKINGSKININKIAVNTPNLNLTDKKNAMSVLVKSTNIDLNSLALNGSNIDIKTIKLSRPDINFNDRKNNISLKTNDLQIYVNKLSQKASGLNINAIRVVQPRVNFLNTKDKTNIQASNIDLSVSGIYNSNKLLKVTKTVLNKPTISVILPKSTNTKKEEEPKVVKKETTSNNNTKKIDIGPIDIKNGQLNFEDKNLPIAFKTTVSKLNGKISEFRSEKSSTSKLSVNGIVNKYGTTKITGVVNPNSIKVLTDINMIFKNIAMQNFTPYTGKFIGRELASGRLDLDLKYNIEKSNLEAQNNVLIKQLKLGDEVKSEDAVSLPLELAIALLEDSNGVIDLNLPVSGNVDDPQFSIAPIVFKAFVNLIMKAVTAPFSLLGAVFGYDPNEINSVDFDFGKNDITPIQKETLDKITNILTKKQDLVLELAPSYDKQKDLYALKKANFEKIVNNEIPDKSNKDYEEDYIDLLKDLYEDFDKDADDLKQSYTKNDNLDLKAYKKALEEFIIAKQNITQKDLEIMAKNRVENIKNYLVKDKSIPSKQIKVIKKIDVKTQSSKTSNIDLKISKL